MCVYDGDSDQLMIQCCQLTGDIVMVARGVAIAEVDRTVTNGVRLGGHVMVPNLGYKKDTFLEPSLISNFHPDIPITTTSFDMCQGHSTHDAPSELKTRKSS